MTSKKILVFGVIAMLSVGVVSTPATAQAKTATKAQIAQQNVTAPTPEFVISRLQTINTIVKIEATTEDNDPNGLMNKPGGYLSQVYFLDSQIPDEYKKISLKMKVLLRREPMVVEALKFLGM